MTSTGDANLDLYLKSKKPGEKSNKTTAQYEYEKNKDELTFQPKINRGYHARQTEPVSEMSEFAINAHIAKQKKARDEKDFKRMMHGRNPYSATKGIDAAK